MNAIQYFDWGETSLGKDLKLDVIQTREENKKRFFLVAWGFKDTLGNMYLIDSYTISHFIEYGWSYYGIMGPHTCPKFTQKRFTTLKKGTLISEYYLLISFPENVSFEPILQNITVKINDNTHYSRVLSLTKIGTYIGEGGTRYSVKIAIDGENLPFIKYNKGIITI